MEEEHAPTPLQSRADKDTRLTAQAVPSRVSAPHTLLLCQHALLLLLLTLTPTIVSVSVSASVSGHASGCTAIAIALPLLAWYRFASTIDRTHKALVIAARDGNKEAVSSSLQQCTQAAAERLLQPVSDWQGVTALYAAAMKGRPEIVRLLLEWGAPVNQANDHGDTALCIASQEGHCDCIFHLLSAGAAIDRQSPSSGATALMLACHSGHDLAADLLLRAGAATDLVNADGNSGSRCRPRPTETWLLRTLGTTSVRARIVAHLHGRLPRHACLAHWLTRAQRCL